MRSAFFGFHVASSALFTARANLNVIAHNIANEGIPGFSRQVAQSQASMPLNLRDSRGMYGTGSQVTGIIQIRDHFLDRMFWNQNSVLGQSVARNNNLSFMETVFNDLNNSGVHRSFTDFFARIQNLTGNAGDATFRTAVITQANTLAEMLNHNARALQKQQGDVNREISDTVGIINSLGAQITSLNVQIRIFEQDGSNANDLRDQRALLIDQLSELANISVEEVDFSGPGNPNDRRLSVMLNGYDFVNNDILNRLAVRPRESDERRNEMDIPGLYDISFANGSPFNMYSRTLGGALRGLIDIRDGNGGFATEFGPPPANAPLHTNNFAGIPYYMNQLNEMVRTFARAMNEGRNVRWEEMGGTVGHIYAFDASGANTQMMLFDFIDPNTGLPAVIVEMDASVTPPVPVSPNNQGIRRWLTLDANGNLQPEAAFSLTPPANVARDQHGNPLFTLCMDGMNALNFRVNPKLMETGGDQLLATTSDFSNPASANDVILGWNVVGTDRSLFREGRLLDFIIATSNRLAVDREQARRFHASYEEITTRTHNLRLSIKDVDVNEEMMNLVRFQTMFTAASRLVNVMDTVYDTLINRLGNV